MWRNKNYEELLSFLESVKPENWNHRIGYTFSWVNDGEIVLYSNGWINFKDVMFCGFPFIRFKGKRLFEKVRDLNLYPTSNKVTIEKRLEELKELAKK